MMSSAIPVSDSHSSLIEGAPSGKAAVSCPIEPSDKARRIVEGAPPLPAISRIASMARPSGVSGPY